MEIEELRGLIDELNGGREVLLADIPDIELYMDQVTTFIDNRLSHLKRDAKDKILTSTMINNYTKAGILIPPHRKKYSREHMIFLILIYHLKQVLSISDIEMLLKPIMVDQDLLDVAQVYSAFLAMKEGEAERLYQLIEDRLSIIKECTAGLEEEKKVRGELLLTVILLVTQAGLQKRLAEKIIDHYFAD